MLRPSYCKGVQSSALGARTFLNVLGITPMTVYRLSSSVICLPTIVRSPPKRLCQDASLRITTLGPFSRSSDASKSLPSSGDTPSV